VSVQTVAAAGTALLVAGMMLVIGGVLTTGLFLPGVFVIGLGLLVFAAAGVLGIVRPGNGVLSGGAATGRKGGRAA
jgi:hypothetical protein